MPDGKTIVDQVKLKNIPRDVSSGRYPDGSEDWHFIWKVLVPQVAKSGALR